MGAASAGWAAARRRRPRAAGGRSGAATDHQHQPRRPRQADRDEPWPAFDRLHERRDLRRMPLGPVGLRQEIVDDIEAARAQQRQRLFEVGELARPGVRVNQVVRRRLRTRRKRRASSTWKRTRGSVPRWRRATSTTPHPCRPCRASPWHPCPRAARPHRSPYRCRAQQPAARLGRRQRREERADLRLGDHAEPERGRIRRMAATASACRTSASCIGTSSIGGRPAACRSGAVPCRAV